MMFVTKWQKNLLFTVLGVIIRLYKNNRGSFAFPNQLNRQDGA